MSFILAIVFVISCFLLISLINRYKGTLTNWPIVGMLPSLLVNLHNIHELVVRLLESTSCTFLVKGIWFAHMDLLFTSDPTNINHIFNTNFVNYPKGQDFLDIFSALGNGIFNANFESWKVQRRMAHGLIANQSFQSYNIKITREKLEKGVIPLLNVAVLHNSTLNLQDVFLRLMFDTTSILVMGVDTKCLSPELPLVPFAKAVDDAEEVLIYRHIVPSWLWKLFRWGNIGFERKVTLAEETVNKFLAKHVGLKKQELHNKIKNNLTLENDQQDLLSSYMNTNDTTLQEKSKGVLDIKSYTFLRDTTLTLLLAGRDPTAAGLAWFFWLMWKNPDVEAKILEEASSNPNLFNKANIVSFNPSELNSLVYLHASLYESLRLYPPVPFEHKGALKPDLLPSGHRVDPKTKIVVSLYAMARMKKVWGKDCKEFKPERWIGGDGNIKHEPSYKFMTFNTGPRTCIGKDIALTQMKIVVLTLLMKFSFEVVDEHLVVPKTSVVLHMKNGLKVRVKKRYGF